MDEALIVHDNKAIGFISAVVMHRLLLREGRKNVILRMGVVLYVRGFGSRLGPLGKNLCQLPNPHTSILGSAKGRVSFLVSSRILL
jgi:hypothetical protein